MKGKKRKWGLVLKVGGVLLLLAVVLLFSFRNTILQTVLSKVSDKFRSDYNCSFSVSKAGFSGINGIEFSEITLAPSGADTLAKIHELKTTVNLWKLITGDIQLGKLEVNKGFVQLVRKGSHSNYEAFLRSKKDKDDASEVNYARLLNRISSRLLNLTPTDMQVKGFAVMINDNGNNVIFDFNELALANKKLRTLINVHSDGFSQEWSIRGFADPRERKADLTFSNTKGDTIKLPYLKKKFNLKAGFSTIRFNLERLAMDGGELHIAGYSSINNLVVNNPKIASKDVVINKARLDYHWIVGERSIALDSTSAVQLNDINCRPYLSYTKEEGAKSYAVKLDIPKMKAQDFINSLPKGLFRHFEGMEAQGNFSYALNFRYNDHQPNKIVFESKMTPDGMKITKYGEADLNKINAPFIYRAIDKGVAQRPVFVGPSNWNYTPLSEMSPYLKKCVLTSEDPSFMSHRGFINEAFKESISKNIRTKKFARGASTISMQLVKNVFLTREKTLSRKLEEILLVYILENNHISTKDRMLEVYFNIIEWGPNVYGIAEASEFYFQKRPADLNVNECLFLATIIPNPKGFMSKFDAENQLRPSAKQTEKFLTKLMFRRGLLTANDTIDNFPLYVSGPAKSFLKQKSVPAALGNPTEEFEF